MRISTFKHFVADSMKNLKRNRTLTIASVATVAATLFIFGIMLLILLTINVGVNEVESTVEVKVFLKKEITINEKKEIEDRIRNMDEVDTVIYETKDEALAKLKEQLGEEYKNLTYGYDKRNPMPESYIVKVKKPEYVGKIVEQVKDMPGIDVIKDGKKIVSLIVTFSKAIKWVGIIVLMIFMGLSLFLIGNTIKITVYNRRKEINIMKYIGATDWFIRWPFIIEGIVIGLIGAIISVVLLYYGYGFVYLRLSNGFVLSKLIKPVYIITSILWKFILAGICIGSFGSYMSMRKFLNV